MWQWNDGTMELYHYGVKGMKWGVRKARPQGGISGMIRRKSQQNASELRELKGYARNPSKLAKSRISTAIRNHQIKNAEKTRKRLLKDDMIFSNLERMSKEQRERKSRRGLKAVEGYLRDSKILVNHRQPGGRI